MKVILILKAFLLIALQSVSQFSVKGPAGKSGIVAIYDRTSLNYEVGTSRASFTIGFKDKYRPKDYNSDEDYPDLPNDFLFNFQVGMPITDNIGSVFGSGKFTPGVDLSFEPVYVIESEKNYKVLFARLEYAVSETKFGFIDNANRVNLITKPTNSYGVALGANLNLGPQERTIFGFSAGYFKNKKSAIGLKKRDFITAQQTLTNVDGTTTTIVTKEERFFGAPVDLGIFQARADAVLGFTKFIPKEKTRAMISLLGSLSFNSLSNNKTAWFLSAGPGFHPKNNYGQILASVQVELNDFTNGLGLSPTLKEQFAVKLYLGIPFNLFKKKENFAAVPPPAVPAQ